jgi:hypothetical protein
MKSKKQRRSGTARVAIAAGLLAAGAVGIATLATTSSFVGASPSPAQPIEPVRHQETGPPPDASYWTPERVRNAQEPPVSHHRGAPAEGAQIQPHPDGTPGALDQATPAP